MGFTVLMPVYYKENAEHFDLALESNLVGQSLLPDELVLVCDGPLTPELDAVVERYKERFPDILQVFRLEKNSGIANALNYGLKKCSYDLIARSDSDDICVPFRFEKETEYLMNHPEVDVVGGAMDEFETNPSAIISLKKMPCNTEACYKMAKKRNPLNHMTVMFRKQAVETAGGYDSQLPPVEDYDLWVRLLMAGKRIANLEEVLVHARIGNGRIKRRSNSDYIVGWKEINKKMLTGRMIGIFRYILNMTGIRLFVNTPASVKRFIYLKILRSR